MDNVNIALFDYDRYNALYFFVLNADEHIYLRYGGRDNVSQDSYLHLDSLELALRKGLDLHRDYQGGKIKANPPPKPMLPNEIPLLLERTYDRGACVECHLIGDFQLQQREIDGTLDKVTEMFRSPDLKDIGVLLDVPKGLVVKEARGAAQQAGLEAGDLISSINGVVVWTFADLQYAYDKVARRSKHIAITVERAGKPVELTVMLPFRWWYSDIRYKQLTIDPRTYFESRALTEAEKKEHNFPTDGFASRVSHVDTFARVLKSHALKLGDVIFGIDGVQRDEFADTAEFFIRLRKKAGDTVTLDVVRDGKRFQMLLRTFQMNFRK